MVNLQLFAEGSRINYIDSIVKELSALDQQLIRWGTVLDRPFTADEINKYIESDSERVGQLVRLQSRFLLQMTPTENGRDRNYEIPPFLKDYVNQQISTDEKNQIAQQLASHLNVASAENQWEVLFHTLKSQDRVLLEKILTDPASQGFDSRELEILHHKLLVDFIDLIEPLLAEKGFRRRAFFKLLNLSVQALFLTGEREKALTRCQRYIDPVLGEQETNGLFPDYLQEVILEYVQLLNRTGRNKQAHSYADIAMPRFDNPLNLHLKIAQSGSLIQLDLLKGKAVLLNLKERVDEQFGPDRSDYSSNLARASVTFQLARALYRLDDFNQAEIYFAEASDLYQKMGKPYFNSVCQLNRAWIFLKRNEWEALENIRSLVYNEAKRFGHLFVAAAFDIIEAKHLRFCIRPQEARQTIEAAIAMLGDSAPVYVRQDALVEKIRILLFLNWREAASRTLEKLKQLLGVEQIRIRDKTIGVELRIIYMECQLPYMTIEEEIEGWERIEVGKHDENYAARNLFHLGILQPGFEDRENPVKILTLARTEFEITRALHQSDHQHALVALKQLETQCQHLDYPISETIAASLLRVSLARNHEDNRRLLDEIMQRIENWDTDQSAKYALIAWAKAEKQKRAPDDFMEWEKAPVRDQHRWRLWWEQLFKKQQSGYLIISRKEEVSCDDVPLPSCAALMLLEEQGEVWVQGKRVEQFTKRHQLKKLLAIFMEWYGRPIGKTEIASLLWGESYNPIIHDARIYTTIQRLRNLLGLTDIIRSHEQGYQLGSQIDFMLVRPVRIMGIKNPKNATLIIKAMESFAENNRAWVARSLLQESTGIPEATLKREISKLLSKSVLKREGAGRSIRYCLDVKK